MPYYVLWTSFNAFKHLRLMYLPLTAETANCIHTKGKEAVKKELSRWQVITSLPTCLCRKNGKGGRKELLIIKSTHKFTADL